MLSIFWLVYALFVPSAWSQAAGWPDISSPITTVERPKDAALIVSIEDYQYLADRTGAVKNGRDWYLFFTGGQKLDTSRISWLKDGDATAENILKQARRLNKKMTRRGRLWFVFVGHGATSSNGQDFFLLPAEVESSAASVEAGAIPLSRILAALGRKKMNGIAVVDASFTGKNSMGGLLAQDISVSSNSPRSSFGNITAMFASAENELAHNLRTTNRPAFSYLVLGGLRGWADGSTGSQDGSITIEEVMSYSRQVMTDLQLSQNPYTLGSDTQLAIGQGNEKAPDLTALKAQVPPKPKKATKKKMTSGFSRLLKGKKKTANAESPFAGIRSRLSMGSSSYSYEHSSEDPGKETPNNVSFDISTLMINFNVETWLLNDTIGLDVSWGNTPYSVDVMSSTVEKSVMNLDIGAKYRYPIPMNLLLEGGLGYQMSKGIGYRYENNFASLAADEKDLNGVTASAGVVRRFGAVHLRGELKETFAPGPVNTGIHFMSDIDVYPIDFQNATILVHLQTGMEFRHFDFDTLNEGARINDRQFYWNIGSGILF